MKWPKTVTLGKQTCVVLSDMFGLLNPPKEAEDFLEGKAYKISRIKHLEIGLFEVESGKDPGPILQMLLENYSEALCPVLLDDSGHMAICLPDISVKFKGDQKLLGEKYGLSFKERKRYLTATVSGGPLKALLLCLELQKEEGVEWVTPNTVLRPSRGI